MSIYFLNRRALVKIELLKDNGDRLVIFSTKFYNFHGEDEIVVESDGLYYFCLRNHNINNVNITYEYGHNRYFSSGTILKIAINKDKRYVYIKNLTDTKVEPRRAISRFNINMDVNIYLCDEGKPSKHIAYGNTKDINFNAINLESNTNLRKFSSKCFFLEFVLFNKNYFLLPVILIRQDNSNTYIFEFNFFNDNDKRRLTDSLLQNFIK